MTDENLRNLVLKHDGHLDMLSKSINDLTSVTKDTNIKMDKLSDIISTQMLLNEKVFNMDKNTSEAFSRAFKRIEALEEDQDMLNAKLSEMIWKAIAVSVTITVFIFGYLYADVQGDINENHALSASVIRIDKDLSILINEVKGGTK